MIMAQGLMDGFISERCGDGYKRGTVFTVESPNGEDQLIKLVCIVAKDGTEHDFYFDLSRPLGVAMKAYKS